MHLISLPLLLLLLLGYRHGDMLYLRESRVKEKGGVLPVVSKVQEDEVDKLLATRDGRVHRKKDPQM